MTQFPHFQLSIQSINVILINGDFFRTFATLLESFNRSKSKKKALHKTSTLNTVRSKLISWSGGVCASLKINKNNNVLITTSNSNHNIPSAAAVQIPKRRDNWQRRMIHELVSLAIGSSEFSTSEAQSTFFLGACYILSGAYIVYYVRRRYKRVYTLAAEILTRIRTLTQRALNVHHTHIYAVLDVITKTCR